MNRVAAWVLGAALVLAPVATAVGETFDLSVTRLKEPLQCRLPIRWTTVKPQDVTALPELKSGRPVFGHMPLGDRPPTLAAVDGGAELVVYVDTNGNGSLAGEKPYRLKKLNLSGRTVMATDEIVVPVRVDLGDGRQSKSEYRFRFADLFGSSRRSADSVRGALLSYAWSGVVTLGDDRVRLSVFDRTADAKVTDEQWAEYVEVADDIHAPVALRFHRPLTRYIAHRGAFYELAVRRDGAQVTVTPYTGELGHLSLQARDGRDDPAAVSRLTVYGRTLYEDRQTPSEELALPPGAYQFAYTLRTERGGEAEYTFSPSQPFLIGPGKTVEVVCGGPLLVDASVGDCQREGDGMRVQVDIAAHTAAGHAFQETSRTGAPAKVEILNRGGKVLARGEAEYG